MGLWEFFNEVHLARDLEVGEAPDGKLANVCRSRRRVGPQYHGRRDVLAQRGVGHGKGCGFRHRRMFQEHFVDFPRREFLATAVDDLLLATDQNQVSVVVEKTVIPRLEPIAHKRGLVRHWITVVPRHDARATDDDLPRLPSGQQCPSVVHDRNVQTHRYAG